MNLLLKEKRIDILEEIHKQSLRDQTTTLSELMRETGRSLCLVSKMLNNFEEADIITRTKKGRTNQIEITDFGSELAKDIRNLRNKTNDISEKH